MIEVSDTAAGADAWRLVVATGTGNARFRQGKDKVAFGGARGWSVKSHAA